MAKIHPAIAEHAMEENEKLRRLLEAALFYVPNAGLRADISAALSRQADPADTYTAVDMATAAAQGFRDGQAATVKDCLTVQPMAYAVFAANGNAVCFSTRRDHQSLVALEKEGHSVVSLAPIKQTEQPVSVPEGWLIELGFDVLDRTSRSVESKSHTPTIKVILPPCEPVDSSAWDLRDEVARRIGSVLATPDMAAKDRP